MDQDKTASPAYRRLSPAGRRVLEVIEEQADRGNKQISFSDFQRWCAMPRSSVGYGLTQCRLLGFCEITPVGNLRSNSFRLIATWKTVSKVEARKLRRMAGASKQQATPSAPSVTAAPADG